MARGAWRTVIVRAALAALLLIAQFGFGSFAPTHAGGLSPLTTTLAFPSPPVLATAAAMLDVDSGSWLYLQNADQPLPMASTTKIMTAILTIEHGHLTDMVPVSRAAATIGGTSMGLVRGERLRMIDLLYGLLLPSGNDAGVAIAEHLAGSMPAFSKLMNAKAAALHLTHTHYVNSYGAFLSTDGDARDHYTSAHDLVVLARYAMQNRLFRSIVDREHYTVPRTRHNLEHVLININRAIFWYPGADGVKPGWTSGAGLCQVVDAQRYGHHLIVAVLHTANQYTDVRDLLNYGFNDFTWAPSGAAEDPLNQHVVGGSAGDPHYFYPYTGHSIHGAFLTYFLRHGNLAVFGFPRTEELEADGIVEQFFTNQVLTYNPATNMVLPLRLGLTAIPSQSWLARVPPVPNTDWRTYYPQTGHTITYRFRRFYLDNGGPRTFGYPITEKRYQGATLVQYFENTAFVWHPTSASDGYIAMQPLGERQLQQLGLLSSGPVVPVLAPVHAASPTPSPTPSVTSSSTPSATPSATSSTVPSSTPTSFPSPATPTTTASPTGTTGATGVGNATDTPVPPGTPVG